MPVLDEFRLDGKTALLAGNAGGYLPYLAEVLAEAGAHVTVAAPTQELATAAVESAKQHDPDASGMVDDFSNPDGVDQVVSQLTDGGGSIDVLVNSFRTEYFRPLLETPISELGQCSGGISGLSCSCVAPWERVWWPESRAGS